MEPSKTSLQEHSHLLMSVKEKFTDLPKNQEKKYWDPDNEHIC